MNVNEVTPSILAYIGDAVYEQKVREYLVLNFKIQVNELQSLAKRYVSAKNQAIILDKLLSKNILTDDELYTIGRAKNYKPKSKPRYVSIVTYKKATALEALFGMLFMQNKKERIDDIFNIIIGD